MATSQMSEILQHIRRAVLLREEVGRTDGQLLEDYLQGRDESALAALLHRHGPMVWGVCCRVLRNHHDAEDAFQATFLVLIRKAASITSRALLANWLYGVAQQTALKARATAAKRRSREKQVTEMPEPEMVQQDLWHDLKPLLDQELSRLPDRYRVVLVLCDLQGKTRKEAAQQLACPEGTVGGWLARARGMLAERLALRGVSLSSGALATGFLQNAASASVPTALTCSTIKATTRWMAGQAATGVISTKVAALTEGVLQAMLVSQLKSASMALLIVLTCVGGGALALRATAAGQPEPAQKVEAKPDLTTTAKDRTARYDPEARQLQLVPLFSYALLDAPQPSSNTWATTWPPLQAELQITAEQAKALWECRAQVEHRLKGLRRITREDNRLYDDEREKGLLQLKEGYARILKPGQFRRLEQIGMQMRFVFTKAHAGGLSFPDVQKALNFSDKQSEQLKAIDADAENEWASLQEQLMLTGGSYAERVRIHKATLEKAVKLLTKEQQRAWAEKVGEPWKVEEWGQ